MSRDYTAFFDFQRATDAQKKAAHADFSAALDTLLSKLAVVESDRSNIIRGLWEKMSAPPRHYHSPVHILAMFDHAAKLGIHLSHPESLALWFHDSIYDPDAPNGSNEELSALHFLDELADTGIDPLILRAAVGMIRSTARHTEDALPKEHALVLDLDLSGFTAPPPVFRELSEALRREYPQLSDADYARSAARFLDAMLQRKSIFRSTHFAPLEATAQKQIRAELDRLTLEAG